jgi:D-amino-acid oxidase
VRPLIVIVGAGITGLKVADLLELDGVLRRADVEVRYDGHLLASTSLVAAGFVLPAGTTDPRLWGEWFRWSMCAWREEWRTRAQWGIRRVRATEVSDRPIPPPLWGAHAVNLQPIDRAQLPVAYRDGYGVRYDTFLVPPHRYVPRLVRRLRDRGVQFRRCPVASLDGVSADLVVNAAGVWAPILAGDSTAAPVRGDVVVLPPILGVDEPIVDEESFTYVLPQGDRVVVGGTALAQPHAPEEWDVEPRPEIAADILQRAARLEPRIVDQPVLGHRVGLRPARPTVRAELERRAQPVIHAYGTGGSGWTVAPALARWVVDTVKDELAIPPYDWRPDR